MGRDERARTPDARGDRRLAVLDRDIDAIIRTHARDRQVAAWLQDTAQAFEEIGEIDLAIDWAHQAADHGPGHQALKAAAYWCDLLARHRPAEQLAARHEVFQRWPSATRPDQSVLFSIGTLHDPSLAWEQALELDNDLVWVELANAYEKIDPLAVLPVHQRLVEHELVTADARHYRLAIESKSADGREASTTWTSGPFEG